jgi:hypothetical protein
MRGCELGTVVGVCAPEPVLFYVVGQTLVWLRILFPGGVIAPARG